MGRSGLEHAAKTQGKTPISRQGAAEGAAFTPTNGPPAAQASDFAAALAMIDTLPLSPMEKADAVRRLMEGEAQGFAQGNDGKQ